MQANAEMILSTISIIWRLGLRDAAMEAVKKTDNKLDDGVVGFLDLLLGARIVNEPTPTPDEEAKAEK